MKLCLKKLPPTNALQGVDKLTIKTLGVLMTTGSHAECASLRLFEETNTLCDAVLSVESQMDDVRARVKTIRSKLESLQKETVNMREQITQERHSREFVSKQLEKILGQLKMLLVHIKLPIAALKNVVGDDGKGLLDKQSGSQPVIYNLEEMGLAIREIESAVLGEKEKRSGETEDRH